MQPQQTSGVQSFQNTGGGGVALNGGGGYSPQMTFGGVPSAGTLSIPSAPKAPAAPSAPSTPAADPNAAAQAAALAQARAQYGDPALYQSQVAGFNGQINQLDPALNVGLQNVQDQYQQAKNSADYANQLNQRNYNQGVQQNLQSFMAGRTNVQNQTHANANALQRLLGMNGAGNSSAALEAAPYAAALQGSQDLSGVQQTYGQNQQNLDTTWNDQQTGYKKGLDQLNQQLYQGQNGVRSQIAQQKASLLDQIANAQVQMALANGKSGVDAYNAGNPYRSQESALQDQITQYGRANPNPVIQAPTIDTTAVKLSPYQLAKGTAPQNVQTPGGAAISPNFLGILSGAKRDAYGAPIQ